MEFTITSNQLLGFFALVSATWGFIRIIKEIKKPSDDLKEQVAAHESYLKSDNLRLKEVEDSNKLILQSLLVIINHDITGNGIDKLKETRTNIQEYLINR